MVAITTAVHPPRAPRADCAHRPRTAGRPAGRGGAPSPARFALRRAVAVLVALVFVLCVAVGTAAVGRVLDGHRGIPAVVVID